MRSTLIAVGVAAVLLVGVVLPAEYGVDPIGVGRVLGLTEMGRIKTALAREAEAATAAERAAVAQGSPAASAPATPARTDHDSASTVAVRGAGVAASPRQDSMTVRLRPGASIELKLDMRKDQRATYRWRADSAPVNYNTHGEPANPPKGFYHGYGKGTSRGEQGDLVAAFDGMHGWFWRNRSASDVRITLVTSGEYRELREVK
ncbi:MAG: transmembrane anchor protein [Gemmatimonadota bacterium]